MLGLDVTIPIYYSFRTQSHYKSCKRSRKKWGKYQNSLLNVGYFFRTGRHDAWRPAHHDVSIEIPQSPYPMTGVSQTDGLHVMDSIHVLVLLLSAMMVWPFWGMSGFWPGLPIMTDWEVHFRVIFIDFLCFSSQS